MSRITESPEFAREEPIMAQRCHGLHTEGLRYPVRPVGTHYLLIHFDIPFLDPKAYQLSVDGSCASRRR